MDNQPEIKHNTEPYGEMHVCVFYTLYAHVELALLKHHKVEGP